MMKESCRLLLTAALALAAGACAALPGPEVAFEESADRIDIRANGRPVAVYRFGPGLTKPVLHPVFTPGGLVVNRMYPLGRAEGESEDHPHHVGVFFTYDRVNGEGFWNNTTSPPGIDHVAVTRKEGGPGRGRLSTVSHWTGKSGHALLKERRDMVFHVREGEYVIDFFITLTALTAAVTFEDTKEGMFGLRVAPWLREKDGTGRYLSSNGDRTERNVWGKRARWVRLEGNDGGRPGGAAMVNHPMSVNFPTFWHARGYGLFAANPLGQRVFVKSRGNPDAEPFALSLEPGKSALFAFRLVLYDGSRTAEEIEKHFEEFAGLEPPASVR